LTQRHVVPRLSRGGRLEKAEVSRALAQLFQEVGQQPWGPSTRLRWVEGLLSVLRDVGAVGRGPARAELLPYAARPEAFAFHLWGLFEQGLRGAALHECGFWRLLLLDAGQTRDMVGRVADRGWWKLTSVGGMDEIVPVHGSLAEWLGVGLG
jgi:hypothetical protein